MRLLIWLVKMFAPNAWRDAQRRAGTLPPRWTDANRWDKD